MIRRNLNYAVIIITLGFCLSLSISTILQALDPDSSEFQEYEEHQKQHRQKASRKSINDELNNIFWFVQLSDLHISIFRDLGRIPDLKRFCSDYLPVIDPQLILVTGDLVDGKLPDSIESTQFEDEWKIYKSIVQYCRMVHKKTWIDIRGNHDSFDVVDSNSENNYFKSFSALTNGVLRDGGTKEAYKYSLKLPFGTYSFVGFDACVTPGLNRPLNFFGHLNSRQISTIRDLASTTDSSNHTIWFGHYPTSLIVHKPSELRDIMGPNSIAYVCGHLHSLGSFVPRMYSRQKTGQLELELADWKDNRMVMVFDHDLLSFGDFSLGDWPLIIITNPKDNLFISPRHESADRIKTSTHIRILVFNPDPVTKVSVHIDQQPKGTARHKQGPLYVLSWTPAEYLHGSHLIQVTVKDAKGRTQAVSQTFSLDGCQPQFRLLPRILLMLNIYSVGKLVFGLMAFMYVFLLTCLRHCDNIRSIYIQVFSSSLSSFQSWMNCLCMVYSSGQTCLHAVVNRFLLKLWLTARVSCSFYLLTGSVFYVCFGPWFVGELLKGKTGIVFVWGMIVNGTFIPGSHMYFYGIFQILTFNIPLLMLTSHILDLRRRNRKLACCQPVSVTLPLVLLSSITIYLTKEFPSAYGWKALVFGPVRTGNVFILLLSIVLCNRHQLRNDPSVRTTL